MDIWNYLEYAAWALSVALRPVDVARLDPDRHDLFGRGADLLARRRDRSHDRTAQASEGADHGETDRPSLRRRTVEQDRPAARSGPAHVWALGVGIVLVGEYMGWNFAVGKGGAYAALIACWFAGLLYTCVAMINSEVTSTVAAAGGQYTQAKHIVGPLMAFNVGLYLVMAYTMLEAANAITIGYLLDTVANMAGHERHSTSGRSSSCRSCSWPG